MHGARQLLGGSSVEWEGWLVRVDWMTDDDGRAVPVSLSLTGYRGDPECPDPDAPLMVVSRDVAQRLPVARLLDESRELMLQDGGSELPWVPADTYAVDTSTHVGRLARAAFIHADEVSKGNRAPSKRTCERLALEGLTSGAGQPLTETRVRTWIAEARKRGLYPGQQQPTAGPKARTARERKNGK